MVFGFDPFNKRNLSGRIDKVEDLVRNLEMALRKIPVRILLKKGEENWVPTIATRIGTETWVKFNVTLVDNWGNVLAHPGDSWYQMYNVERRDFSYTSYSYKHESVPNVEGWVCFDGVWWKITDDDFSEEWEMAPNHPDYNLGWEGDE